MHTQCGQKPSLAQNLCCFSPVWPPSDTSPRSGADPSKTGDSASVSTTDTRSRTGPPQLPRLLAFRLPEGEGACDRGRRENPQGSRGVAPGRSREGRRHSCSARMPRSLRTPQSSGGPTRRTARSHDDVWSTREHGSRSSQITCSSRSTSGPSSESSRETESRELWERGPFDAHDERS